MNPSIISRHTRRKFIKTAACGIAAMGTNSNLMAGLGNFGTRQNFSDLFNGKAKAKRVILLFQSGGPSHLDLFHYKPLLKKYHGRKASEVYAAFSNLGNLYKEQAILASPFLFNRHGQSGLWISELLPHLARQADRLCIVNGISTTKSEHAGAARALLTLPGLDGNPSLGACISDHLNSDPGEIPPFIVLQTQNKFGQAVNSELWSPGNMPGGYGGISLHTGSKGIYRSFGETEMDQSFSHSLYKAEKDSVVKIYGPDVKNPGTFAAHCLLARQLIEKGAGCVLLIHRGWDQHFFLNKSLRIQCRETDQPTAGLIADLLQRGLLEETLLVWAGEFGRSPFANNPANESTFGRPHHNRSFSVFLAGGGINGGLQMGDTDEFGWNSLGNNYDVINFQQDLFLLLNSTSRQKLPAPSEAVYYVKDKSPVEKREKSYI